MSVTNPERVVTKQDLADFYDELLPFISPKSYAGFTPIGTIIPMIAESAPANYLICNGATYNKSDYPELAAHLLSMTSHSMYEVSGDATKFKVPDLRGEFLRGTGANGHANQGSGANVGVHQNSTQLSKWAVWSNTALGICGKNATDDSGYTGIDSDVNSGTTTKVWKKVNISSTAATGGTDQFTIRPTNTSVLFCIAVKNIYLDPKNDYSTEEKVIGTWINNEPLYQKTFALDNITGTTAGTFKSIVTDISSLNIDFIADIRGIIRSETSFQVIDYRENNGGQQLKLQASTTSLQLVTNMAIDGMKYWVTLRYTKTS